MGLLGERLSGRDVAIGIVLALALGFGLLFLSLNRSTSLQATALLFGNVLAVSPSMLATLLILGVGRARRPSPSSSRPLLFATLQPELAEARGVSPRLIGTLFLAVVALAVAQSVQIVGVLLVFALMVGPPAAAQLLTTRVIPGIVLSAGARRSPRRGSASSSPGTPTGRRASRSWSSRRWSILPRSRASHAAADAGRKAATLPEI